MNDITLICNRADGTKITLMTNKTSLHGILDDIAVFLRASGFVINGDLGLDRPIEERQESDYPECGSSQSSDLELGHLVGGDYGSDRGPRWERDYSPSDDSELLASEYVR